MAQSRRPLLVGLVMAAVVVLIAVVLWKCGADAPTGAPPESFSFEQVKTSSPDLPVVADTVRGTHRDGYMDWACLLTCRDPGGCRADLRLTVHYTSNGEAEEIVFQGSMDVPVGARARLGGVQRPAHRVDAVTRIDVEVLRTFEPGAPVPTPEL